jgi:hypothetical protein
MSETTQGKPRDRMPSVWRKIGEYRQLWGKEHVAECIRRGMAGEPGWFYASEAGHVEGTPFTAEQVTTDLLKQAVALGHRYWVVMRPPAAKAPADGSD